MPAKPTHYVGTCRICGTGPLGLRTCGDCGAVVVVCDECDVTWPDADFAAPPATTGTTTLPCPHCSSDLYEPPGHWSTGEEVAAAAWVKASALEVRVVGTTEFTETGDTACD